MFSFGSQTRLTSKMREVLPVKLKTLNPGSLFFFYGLQRKYKVVQIWPGQTVTCLHTNSPGHIWTTLYYYYTLYQLARATRNGK